MLKKSVKKPVKKAAKKPVKKIAVGAASRATGKKPTARLKKRRSQNTKKGYYPNPVTTFYAVEAVNKNGAGFLSSMKPGFDTEKKKALLFDKRTAGIVAGQLRKQFAGAKFSVVSEKK